MATATSGDHSPSWRRGVDAALAWLSEHRLDIAIVVGLGALAASVRLPLLPNIPDGLHGDEAWTGFDAARVLEEGWIGPYVPSALGQAAGPIYWAAPFVAVFGETVFSIRFAMAVLGIATVVMAYLTFKEMFGRTVAVFGALLLAFGIWHLHYSRLAFLVISWPLLELLTLFFLFRGIKSGSWFQFGLAGLFFGLGIYTYNAYLIFVVPVVLFVGWIALGLAISPDRVALLKRYVPRAALMGAVALIVTVPMLRYIADDSNQYFNHQELISTFEQDDWKAADFSGKLDILQDNSFSFYGAAFWSGDPDEADGAGQQAMVDRITLALLILGTGMAVWRWRNPASVALLLMVLILPVATWITIQGTYRQTLGVVPFLALLAALPLALWWERTPRLPGGWRYASYGAMAGVLSVIVFLNLNNYFNDFAESELARATFTPELVDTAEFMADLPDDTVIYFYSDRWGFGYETVQYLAGDHEGEDRSEAFGEYSLEPDRSRDVAYVFMDPYRDRLPDVVAMYPGGTEVQGGEDAYVAYLLPHSEDAPADGPPPPPDGDGPDDGDGDGDGDDDGQGAQRDQTRTQDLAGIQQAIDAYVADGGTLPSTNNDPQTICAFPDLDAGCVFDLGDELAHDPLGDASLNGYFWRSDGATYTLYAIRETDSFPACEGLPEFFDRFDSVLCVEGPDAP